MGWAIKVVQRVVASGRDIYSGMTWETFVKVGELTSEPLDSSAVKPGEFIGPLVATDEEGCEWDVPQALATESRTKEGRVTLRAATVGPFTKRQSADTPHVVGV